MSILNRILKRRTAQDITRFGPPATFTRASTAMLNGVQYASGVPRIQAGAIMVEEGTTNLLLAGAENFVTGWVGWSGETCTVTDYPVNIPGIGDVVAKRITGNGAGSSNVKYHFTILSRPNPHTDTVSMWAMLLSGNVKISLSGFDQKPLTATMTRIASSALLNTTSSQVVISTTLATDILDIVVYQPQIENKPYATSYTPPGTTRAAESLSVPAACLSITQGTIEMDFVVDSVFRNGSNNRLFQIMQAAGVEAFSVYAGGTNQLALTSRNAVGTAETTYAAGTLAALCAEGRRRWAFRYSVNELSVWLDGVKVITKVNPTKLPTEIVAFFLGHSSVLTGYTNGHFSNLRISNIARTDTEMAYTGQLVPDSKTTFFRKIWR